MQLLLLGMAFALEIVAFIGFAAVVYAFHLSHAVQTILFVALLLGVLGFWSVFMAPKSPKRLEGTAYYMAKTIIYTIAAAGIYATRNLILGIVFLALTFINELLLKYTN